MFSRWGAFVYRFRRPVAALALLIALASTSLAVQASDSLSSGGWLDADSESAAVSARLDTEFGAGKSSVIALFRSDTPGADATSAAFQGAIATSVGALADDPRVTGFVGYAETGDRRFISTAGDAAYIVIELDMTDEGSVEAVDDIRAAIAPPAGYTYQLTGYGPVTKDSAEQSEKDLQKAEAVSLPIAALVLLFVFASVVAAGMPLLVAGLAIPSSLALIWIVAQQIEMSIFVLNIATMLGLALAIDYSLFIVSRFREELRRGRSVGEAVERTVATAGKAVAFSGIAVGVGLFGLVLFEAPAIRSIGIAGALVTLCSVVYGLTFLPAVLGMLGHRVNALTLAGLRGRIRPLADRSDAVRTSRWERVAHGVMRRPDRGPRADAGRAAHRRDPVPAPRAGGAGRRHLPGRRREPRRLRGPAGGVRPGRDDADRHPRRRAGLADRCRDHRGPDRLWRDARGDGATSIGSRGPTRSTIRPPVRCCRPTRWPRSMPSPTVSDRPDWTPCWRATSAARRSGSTPSARCRRRCRRPPR